MGYGFSLRVYGLMGCFPSKDCTQECPTSGKDGQTTTGLYCRVPGCELNGFRFKTKQALRNHTLKRHPLSEEARTTPHEEGVGCRSRKPHRCAASTSATERCG